MAASLVFSYKTQYQQFPVVVDHLQETGFQGVFETYVIKRPSLQARVPLGELDAPITLIAYLDNSSATQYFLHEILPILEDEFIADGSLVYYQKPYIPMESYAHHDIQYRRARVLYCVQQLTPTEYHRLSRLLYIQNETSGLRDFEDCLDEPEPEFIKQDALESHSFGTRGISPKLHLSIKGTDVTVLDGIPSMQRIRRIIRSYEIQVGD